VVVGTLRGIIAATSIAVLAIGGCVPTSTPTPTPLPTPASASVPVPTPTPTPPLVPTPKAAGTAVPASIDATGSSDASAALNAFIATVRDGSTIVFEAGGIYLLDSSILLTGRKHLVFEGNGSTLKANGAGSATSSSPFRLNQNNDGIVIRDFVIVGNNTNATTLYTAGQENQMGVLIYGNSNVEVAHNTISHTWGDGVYIGAKTTPQTLSDGISIHDNTFSYIGRMGIAVVAGSHVTVEHNSFDRVGIAVFDIEPDYTWEMNAFITFRDNTVGSYGLSTRYGGFFFTANGAAGSTVHDVTVAGNTVTGGSLLTIVDLARRQNIVFTNNTSTVRATGPVLRFAHVDGLTVTGNVQPLASGVLARITDSTGITYP
jgi:hypothetical protein